MLTLEELKAAKINSAVAREAYDQAEKRLKDALDTKKSFEQKAFTLFGGFTTVALGVIGIAGAVYKAEDGMTRLVLALCASGLVFLIGAFLLTLALRARDHGALGSNPDMWLRRDIIDGEDDVLTLMLAYITYYHQNRINASIESNGRMNRLIMTAIYTGLCAPLVAGLLMFTPLGIWTLDALL